MALKNTKLVGAAGEHFAMYELLRRGYIAALTPEGVPNVDILVSDQGGSRLASLQVKTASARRAVWPMGKKQEDVVGPRLFYCFLMPRGQELADFDSWIVPSSIVAEHLRETHTNWLNGEPKRGNSRNDTIRRSFHHNYADMSCYKSGWLDQYADNWEIVEK